jgi:hypothetical protein
MASESDKASSTDSLFTDGCNMGLFYYIDMNPARGSSMAGPAGAEMCGPWGWFTHGAAAAGQIV